MLTRSAVKLHFRPFTTPKHVISDWADAKGVGVSIRVCSSGQVEIGLHLGREIFLEVDTSSRAEWTSKKFLLYINNIGCHSQFLEVRNLSMPCVLADCLLERGDIELDLSLAEPYRFVVEESARCVGEQGLFGDGFVLCIV